MADEKIINLEDLRVFKEQYDLQVSQMIKNVNESVAKNVSGVTIEYNSSSGLAEPTAGWSEARPEVSVGDYLWTKITFQISDGSVMDGPVIYAKQGDIGPAGNSIFAMTISGTKSANNQISPAANSIINPTNKAYQVGDIFVCTNGAVYRANLIGSSGLPNLIYWTDIQGLNGVGISSTTLMYAQSSSTTQPTSWSTTQPSPTAGYYMHYRLTVTLTDGSSTYKYWYIRNGSNGNTGSDGKSAYQV